MKTLVKGKGNFNPYTDMQTIIAFDFDGVILSHDGEIIPEAIKAMQIFSKLGIAIIYSLFFV